MQINISTDLELKILSVDYVFICIIIDINIPKIDLKIILKNLIEKCRVNHYVK